MGAGNDIIPESGTIGVSDAIWAEARRRAEIIRPLAERDSISRSLAREAAHALQISDRMVYVLARRWRDSGGSLLSIAPISSDGGKGQGRLPDRIEQIVADAISSKYLSTQQLSLAALLKTIQAECRKIGLQPPSVNTVRARINRLRPEEVTRRRRGQNAVRRLQPVQGHFPSTAQPLDVVQIDHTVVDIIVVDSYTRQPIGRPYLTVAIDVHTRCIIGICLTLEPPSAVSVGLCLAHAATDKKPGLERIGIDAEWPMTGKPKRIYVDNGADFHSEALRRGCEVHGIRIDYRPIGSPHYGGIVERVIGTLMKMVHQLPGTTFSNIAEKGDYKSERNAALSLAELEKWLVLAITGRYHLEVHSGIGEPPLVRWQRAIAEVDHVPVAQNPRTFLVDFLPVVRRRIQRCGFMIDHIVYSSNAIKPWIAERDRHHRFVIRRNPCDLSRIFVLDPEENRYVEVPYRSMSQPAITLWEHQRAVKRLRQQGRRQVDEEQIFRTVGIMRTVAEKAVKTTKSARRSVARREHLPPPNTPPVHQPPSTTSGADAIKPFDEIELW